MLAVIRQFAKSKVALVLIALLVVSFAIFGIGDVFRSQGGDWVVRAGSRTVAGAEFLRLFDGYKTQARQRSGQAIVNEEAVAQGLHLRMLEDLAVRESFLESIRRMGVTPSDKLVLEQIRQAPVFFDPVSGRFDQQAYQAQLAQNNLTPKTFESYLRDDLAEQHYGAGVLAGIRAPRVYAAAAQAFESELRDVSFLALDPRSIPAPPAPTDAQLTAFMQQNAERLRRPEFRGLTIVRFDPQAQAANAPVEPAEVQRLFDFRRESLSQPERRTLVQVPAKDAAAAGQVARRLRAGEDAAVVARALGVDPVRYNDAPLSAVADRAVGQAAFRLPVGQVSDPIRGDLGFSVIQVVAITPGRTVTLEQARPQIEAELRQEAANERVNTLIQRFEEAKEGGGTLVEAARAVGAAATSLAPISQQGADERGQPATLEPELLRAAFELPQGGESEVVDLGQGRYAAVRVDRVLPPALPRLAEVRTELAAVWTAQETVKRLQARSDALAARARQGVSLQALAQESGGRFTQIRDISRSGQNVPPQIVGEIFGAKRGEVFTAASPQVGVVVGKVDAIRFPAPVVQSAVLTQVRQAVGQELTVQVGESARQAARRRMKARTNPERAAQVLGVDPTAAQADETGAEAAR